MIDLHYNGMVIPVREESIALTLADGKHVFAWADEERKIVKGKHYCSLKDFALMLPRQTTFRLGKSCLIHMDYYEGYNEKKNLITLRVIGAVKLHLHVPEKWIKELEIKIEILRLKRGMK